MKAYAASHCASTCNMCHVDTLGKTNATVTHGRISYRVHTELKLYQPFTTRFNSLSTRFDPYLPVSNRIEIRFKSLTKTFWTRFDQYRPGVRIFKVREYLGSGTAGFRDWASYGRPVSETRRPGHCVMAGLLISLQLWQN